MADIHHPGDLVRISATFTNAAGTATNPTNVSLKVKPTAGVETSYTMGQLTNSGTGVFHLDYTVPAISPHEAETVEYQFTATGTVQAVEADSFEVVDPYG